MSIDMHCHLDLYPEPFKVVEECRRRGTYVLSVTTTPKAWDGTRKLAEDCQRIRTALGLHPQIAHQRKHEIDLFDALLPSANYVGEVGLDGGKEFKTHWEAQLKVFRHILCSVNRVGGRIMTIHSRASVSAVLDELDGFDGIPILHWFTGTPSQLRRAIDMGCWFSINPPMLETRKGYDLASMIPVDRVLTETDGPFAKISGSLLFPWDTSLVVKKMALIWRCNVSEAERLISNNFKRLLMNNHCG
ncbi:Qat anti-phage system TatD family nuclease QatD [Halomonas sp. NCCP-2165]|nr:Qat anti-phage system TatD family nuclease QatD [Halomonas sp. NCCP-2165]